MKIIGITKMDSYDRDPTEVIVHMTTDELAQMAGWHSAYYLKDQQKPKVGSEYKVGEAYNAAMETLTWFTEHKKELSSAHKRLSKMIEVLEPKKQEEASACAKK